MNTGNQLRFITFYSYKGGVGRSMALANVALDLAAKHGKKVLAIDWDLDAPGLHYYFGLSDENLVNQKGLIDYLDDGARILEASGREGLALSDYVLANVFPTEETRARVDLMTCGKQDADFLGRVTSMNWEHYYDRRGGFAVIESLRRRAMSEYDIVLIDARSGGADAAVLAALHMPDLVVMLFAANAQSLRGTTDIAWRLKNHPSRRLWHRPDLRFVFVPARVFSTSARFSEWLSGTAAEASAALDKLGLLERRLQPRGFAQFLLNVEPEASVGETLLTNLPNGSDLALNKTYSSLSELISQLFRGDVDWRSEPFVPYSFIEAQANDLRTELQETIRRGDENTAHLLRLFLSRLLLRADHRGQVSQVSAMLPGTLAHFQNRGDVRNAAASCLLLGQAELRLGNAEIAEGYLREGLSLVKMLNQPLGEAVMRHDLGNVLKHRADRGSDEYDAAMREYSRSLQIKMELLEAQEAALTLQKMGGLEFNRGNYDQAMSYYEQALHYSKSEGDRRGMAIAYHSMGNLFGQQKQNKEALRYFETALDLQDTKTNPQGNAITLRRIGDCYRHMARTDGEENSIDYLNRALNNYRASLGIAVLLNDLYNVQMLHIKLGETFRQLGDMESAGLSFQEALAVGRVEQHPGGLADVYVRLAEIEVESGAVRQAEGLLRAAERELTATNDFRLENSVKKRIDELRSRVGVSGT